MSETQQPHGNFVAFMNRYKQPGDNKPTFDGRIALPGSEGEQHCALWAHEYTNPKTGEIQIMFNGQADAVAPGDAPLDQVATLQRADTHADSAMLNNLELRPRQLVLFPNGFKDEAPDKKRPDYWGAYNPGKGESIVRISAWAMKDKSDRAMLSGATSYPLPGKTEAEQQAEQTDLADLVVSGKVSKGMPKGKGGRSE